jgi:hypothetical protein
MVKKTSKPTRKAERTRVHELSSQSRDLTEETIPRPGNGPLLTAGDVDADWDRAASVGEEGVGGSVATPDQDVVDEIGRALGVQQEQDAEVRTSDELLRARDHDRWSIEREIAEEAENEERRRGDEG